MDVTWWVTRLGYVGVALLIVCESLGLPVPGQLGLLTAAYLLEALALDPVLLGLVAALSHICGSVTALLIARRVGRLGLQRVMVRWGTLAKGVRRGELLLQRWATWGVLALQLVPYVRDYAGYAAGLAGVSTVSYVAGLVPASLLWAGASVLIGVGAKKAVSPERLAVYFAEHWVWIGVVALAAVLTVLGFRKLPRRAQ